MKNSQNQQQTKQRKRAGFFSMELALTLPILGIILLGLFEYSMLFFARGEVAEASRVGARKASLPGATYSDVEEEIRRVLDPRLQYDVNIDVELGERTGDVVAVAIRVPMRDAAPDLLWPVGFSLNDRDLISETRMIKE